MHKSPIDMWSQTSGKALEEISQEYNNSSQDVKIDMDRIINRFYELTMLLQERTNQRLQMIKEMDNGTNCG